MFPSPRPLRPVPHNVTILSQSKTKRERRRIAGTASCGGEFDAPHNRVAVRRSDRAVRRARPRRKTPRPRNLILFVPDGLRGRIVTPQTAPAMAEVRDKGVNFKNSHSLFPTFTMANGSAMASGHYLGDTGTFSNTIYTGYSSVPAGDTVVPFIENDAVLGDIDEHFNGDYLNEETILKMARAQGFSTAAIGKLGPTYLFDHTDGGKNTIVIDDSTGGKNGVPLSDEMKDALTKAGLPLVTPPRGENGKAGDAKTPGTTSGQCRAAGLYGRCRRQGRAADVQGAQQAVRAGVLVARSRRQPAQHRRQPQHHHARHQRADLDGRHQERRQQSRPAAQGAGRARPCRLDQHHRLLRSRLLDDLEGKQDQPVGERSPTTTRRRISCRWASLRSTWRRR